jgi:hypothetical protein
MPRQILGLFVITENFVIFLSLTIKCKQLATSILVFTTFCLVQTFPFMIKRLKQEKVKNVKIFFSSIFLNVCKFLRFAPLFFW